MKGNSQPTDLQPYEISVTGADMTLELLSIKLRNSDIVVPEFQRQYVWNHQKASKLIESFMLGLPVPQIFLYNRKEDQKLLVVDGMQRLSTVRAFFDNNFKGREFRLSGLNSRWNGMTVNDMSESDLRRLKNITLRSTIFEQVNPNDSSSIVEVFERLNTGGMKLSPQEVRHGVIGGKISQFLGDLNRLKGWRLLRGQPEVDERMDDQEAILRIVALYSSWQNYKRPMSTFLTNYMKENHSMEALQDSDVASLFREAVKILTSVDENILKEKHRFLVTLADSIIPALMIVMRERGDSIDKKNIVAARTHLLKEASASNEKTTDTEAVKARVEAAINIIGQ